MKLVINGVARLAERRARPVPLAVALSDLTSIKRTGTEAMSTLTVTDRGGNAYEFLLSATRPPIGTGHRRRRDDAALRIGQTVKT